MTKESDEKEKLKRKADQLLQEIRIVLPGTQALLGFQFIAFFNETFLELDDYLRQIHFATLIVTMACTLLLISPVAYQQISEDGHTTKNFISFARKTTTITIGLLVIALSGNTYVAARVSNLGTTFAAISTAMLFLFGTGLFFIYSLFKSRRNNNND